MFSNWRAESNSRTVRLQSCRVPRSARKSSGDNFISFSICIALVNCYCPFSNFFVMLFLVNIKKICSGFIALFLSMFLMIQSIAVTFKLT